MEQIDDEMIINIIFFLLSLCNLNKNYIDKYRSETVYQSDICAYLKENLKTLR